MRARAIALFALASLSITPGQAATRTNVVFMMADDLGWHDVSYHGSEIRTPNVDSLARRGVQLDRYYAFPLCSPTRAALMTGRIPLRYGIDRPLETRNGLPLDERLLPEILRAAGYQTAIAGKWHLGLEHVKYHPYNRGFDSVYGHLGPAVDYWTHIWIGGLDWHRDGKALREEGYTTRLLGAEAVRVIKQRDKSKPLFLYVPFNAPHAPLEAPEETIAKYDAIEDSNRRTYAAMVDEMDQAVGRIVGALEAEGMTKDTLVIWCSDNGGAPRIGADNSPLRGGKGSAFEGGIRVPALVWRPGKAEGGRTLTQMATVADWLPTIAAAVGAEAKGDKPLDGLNLWPALVSGAAVERHEPYVVGVFDNIAVFDGEWKYVENTARGGGESGQYLFHITADPEEQRDLSAEQPEKVQALAKVLHDFPRAPTLVVDIAAPGGPGGPGGGRPRAMKKAGGARRGPPGRGANTAGWKEITRAPWVETAKRD